LSRLVTTPATWPVAVSAGPPEFHLVDHTVKAQRLADCPVGLETHHCGWCNGEAVVGYRVTKRDETVALSKVTRTSPRQRLDRQVLVDHQHGYVDIYVGAGNNR
jgi:hypothetical protein